MMHYHSSWQTSPGTRPLPPSRPQSLSPPRPQPLSSPLHPRLLSLLLRPLSSFAMEANAPSWVFWEDVSCRRKATTFALCTQTLRHWGEMGDRTGRLFWDSLVLQRKLSQVASFWGSYVLSGSIPSVSSALGPMIFCFSVPRFPIPDWGYQAWPHAFFDLHSSTSSRLSAPAPTVSSQPESYDVLLWDTFCRHDLGGTSTMLGPIALHNLTTLYDANPNVTTSATYEELDGPGDDDCVNALFE